MNIFIFLVITFALGLDVSYTLEDGVALDYQISDDPTTRVCFKISQSESGHFEGFVKKTGATLGSLYDITVTKICLSTDSKCAYNDAQNCFEFDQDPITGDTSFTFSTSDLFGETTGDFWVVVEHSVPNKKGIWSKGDMQIKLTSEALTPVKLLDSKNEYDYVLPEKPAIQTLCFSYVQESLGYFDVKVKKTGFYSKNDIEIPQICLSKGTKCKVDSSADSCQTYDGDPAYTSSYTFESDTHFDNTKKNQAWTITVEHQINSNTDWNNADMEISIALTADSDDDENNQNLTYYSGCGMSEAVKGTQLEKHLWKIRMFRDLVLSKTKYGRFVINLYYRYNNVVIDVVRRFPLVRMMFYYITKIAVFFSSLFINLV